MEVNNKTIAVTGGGNGMGRELVLQLLSKEARVIAIDINSTALQETVSLAGSTSRLITAVLDIADKTAVAEFAARMILQYGHVDGIINNAGIIQPFLKVSELDDGIMQRVMNVNFLGTLYMVKAFLPHLLTRPEAHIVNISSMGGFLPVPGQTIYGASKAAVKLLTEGLHAELAETQVRVTVVFPGAVKTGITKNSGLELPAGEGRKHQALKILSPDTAARLIIEGMEKNKYRVLVGGDARFMDRLYRLNPVFAARLIANKMKGLLSSNAPGGIRP